jgi:hypothetical protein
MRWIGYIAVFFGLLIGTDAIRNWRTDQLRDDGDRRAQACLEDGGFPDRYDRGGHLLTCYHFENVTITNLDD